MSHAGHIGSCPQELLWPLRTEIPIHVLSCLDLVYEYTWPSRGGTSMYLNLGIGVAVGHSRAALPVPCVVRLLMERTRKQMEEPLAMLCINNIVQVHRTRTYSIGLFITTFKVHRI